MFGSDRSTEMDWSDQGGCSPLPALAARPPVPVFLEIGPMNLLKETHRIWATHREFRTVLRELGNYTDRELSELGIGRGDLARIAYEEAERRIGAPAPASDGLGVWSRTELAASR
jgi:uncharacterized protein YjiS (DUF1127 family)